MTAGLGPLTGIKVLDLSWVMVGPRTSRYLSDLGADVIKVESAKRLDPVRTLGPFVGHTPGPERSVSFHNLNAGKRSIALDLKAPGAAEVLEGLVRWADVVIEGFAPGVAGRLGLDREALRSMSADVIIASTSIGGPEWGGGIGTMGASISGATHLVGVPGQPPTGPYGPWTDEVAPRFIAASIVGALRRRNLTGRGSFIDVAQAEAGIQFLLPALFAAAVDSEAVGPRPTGQPDPWRCPANAYQCADKRWVVVDAADDAAFASLRSLVGEALDDPGFSTLVGRLRSRARVDEAVAEWTSVRSAEEVEVELQAAAVPAHLASSALDLGADPDLRASALATVELPGGELCDLLRACFRMGGRSLPPVRRGPLLGEHSEEVLREVCGLSVGTVAEMFDSGLVN